MEIINFIADVKTCFCISGKHLNSNRYFENPNKWYQLLNTEAKTCRSDTFLFCISALMFFASPVHVLLSSSSVAVQQIPPTKPRTWLKMTTRAIPSLEKCRSWKGELDGSKEKTEIPSVPFSDKVIKIESWKFNMCFSRDTETVLWNFADCKYFLIRDKSSSSMCEKLQEMQGISDSNIKTCNKFYWYHLVIYTHEMKIFVLLQVFKEVFLGLLVKGTTFLR